MPGKYYIAYGSNLSIEQMKVRTPDAVIAGTGILKNWQLLFRMFATIGKCEGYSVLNAGYKRFGFDGNILSEALNEACRLH